MFWKKDKKQDLLKLYLKDVGENLVDDIKDVVSLKRKKRKALIGKIVVNSFKFFGLLILILFLFFSILAAIFFKNIENTYESSLAGKKDLEESLVLAEKNNFNEALKKSELSRTNFHIANTNILKVKQTLLGYLPYLNSYINDAYYLTQSAETIAAATKNIFVFADSFSVFDSKNNFSKLTEDQKKKILENIYNNKNFFTDTERSLKFSLGNLRKVKNKTLIAKFNLDVNDLINKLEEKKDDINKLSPIFRILPSLAGYPKESNYLFVLQNKNELRATGGFIGVYGLAKVKNGDIISLETHDVYHLDMPAKDRINVIPPEPLIKYLNINNWYLRDANWSPDWPTSARKIEWFYRGESSLINNNKINKENFDFVIGITPDFIIDLLNLTGDIKIGKNTYNKDNFMELLQSETGLNYSQNGISQWDRKEVIAEIAKEIKIRLLDLPLNKWGDLASRIENNFSKKNILVLANDEENAYEFSKNNWDGKIKDSQGDYLMVIDSNLAALKTDASINRNISYLLSEDENGLIASLTLRYAHHGSFDWKTTRYRNYIRIYVPFGSKIISSSEKDVKTTKELNKTCFGIFLSVEPGKIGEVNIKYRLPNSFSNLDNYSLLIQKQAGSEPKILVDLNFKNKIKSYSPFGFYVNNKDSKNVKWDLNLDSDKSFEANFK